MPEAFVIEQQILPEITVNSGEGEDGEGSLAAGSKKEPESKLGFRITGGVDFNMPITIFHVRIELNWREICLISKNFSNLFCETEIQLRSKYLKNWLECVGDFVDKQTWGIKIYILHVLDNLHKFMCAFGNNIQIEIKNKLEMKSFSKR